ncbi:uncharacterized protein J3R85_015738 [Psidium guajava]|nr:uncharacterized protein J3R85_015738 [Psidium guajava]
MPLSLHPQDAALSSSLTGHACISSRVRICCFLVCVALNFRLIRKISDGLFEEIYLCCLPSGGFTLRCPASAPRCCLRSEGSASPEYAAPRREARREEGPLSTRTGPIAPAGSQGASSLCRR